MSDLSSSDWENCLAVLRTVARDPTIANEQTEFKTLITKIYRTGRKAARKLRATEKTLSR